MTTTRDQDLAAYRDKLLVALRLRDVPGERIGEVLAEVEAHVAETGEDPVVAFGQPRAYADQVVGATGGRRPWSLDRRTAVGSLLIAAVTFAGTSLTVGGVLGLIGDGRDRVGLGPLGQVVLGVGLVAAVLVVLVRHTLRSDDPVIDPRTGRPAGSTLPSWVPAVVFSGTFVMVVLMAVVVDRLAG